MENSLEKIHAGGNKNAQLICNIAVKRVEWWSCAFYHLQRKPVWQQIRLLQLRKVVGETVGRSSTLCNKICTRFPFYRPKANLPCSKSVIQLPGNTRLPRNFIQSKGSIHATCSCIFCRGNWKWVVQHATSLSNSFCSIDSKQIAQQNKLPILLQLKPVLPVFTILMISTKAAGRTWAFTRTPAEIKASNSPVSNSSILCSVSGVQTNLLYGTPFSLAIFSISCEISRAWISV